jgi:hypothetical protein
LDVSSFFGIRLLTNSLSSNNKAPYQSHPRYGCEAPEGLTLPEKNEGQKAQETKPPTHPAKEEKINCVSCFNM